MSSSARCVYTYVDIAQSATRRGCTGADRRRRPRVVHRPYDAALSRRRRREEDGEAKGPEEKKKKGGGSWWGRRRRQERRCCGFPIAERATARGYPSLPGRERRQHHLGGLAPKPESMASLSPRSRSDTASPVARRGCGRSPDVVARLAGSQGPPRAHLGRRWSHVGRGASFRLASSPGAPHFFAPSSPKMLRTSAAGSVTAMLPPTAARAARAVPWHAAVYSSAGRRKYTARVDSLALARHFARHGQE